MSTITDEEIAKEKEKEEEKRKKIDFKMVTFSLAGRDYGIDIMKVKEISKISRFTYVPNTYPFVRGVHNLRGEIISIIDLRKMFHLESKEEKKGKTETGLENVLILKLKDSLIGVIVDTIDKVIGIASETIKPPPSLFGDINIKYISGVVEYENKLYIILDSDRIFSIEEKEMEYETVEEKKEEEVEIKAPVQETGSPELGFIIETLGTFKDFHVTSLNEKWVRERYKEWKKLCKSRGREFQLGNVEDAEEFLGSFYSPYNGCLWEEDYMQKFISLLPERQGGSIGVWNPGCGKGMESYSLACIARLTYPEARIKVWANDNSLIEISTAPNILLIDQDVPAYILDGGFVIKTDKGFRFKKEINDTILFEYHDILHENAIPQMDIIVARDVLSFIGPEDQEKLLIEFRELLKDDGILVLGQNEHITGNDWETKQMNDMIAYEKIKV